MIIVCFIYFKYYGNTKGIKRDIIIINSGLYSEIIIENTYPVFSYTVYIIITSIFL